MKVARISARNGVVEEHELSAEDEAAYIQAKADRAASENALISRQAKVAEAMDAEIQGNGVRNRLIRELLSDVARLRGIDPADYRQELFDRIKPSA